MGSRPIPQRSQGTFARYLAHLFRLRAPLHISLLPSPPLPSTFLIFFVPFRLCRAVGTGLGMQVEFDESKRGLRVAQLTAGGNAVRGNIYKRVNERNLNCNSAEVHFASTVRETRFSGRCLAHDRTCIHAPIPSYTMQPPVCAVLVSIRALTKKVVQHHVLYTTSLYRS